jgi:hypothetical protein
MPGTSGERALVSQIPSQVSGGGKSEIRNPKFEMGGWEVRYNPGAATRQRRGFKEASMTTVTRTISDWACGVQFKDLPPEVVHEAKPLAAPSEAPSSATSTSRVKSSPKPPAPATAG